MKPPGQPGRPAGLSRAALSLKLEALDEYIGSLGIGPLDVGRGHGVQVVSASSARFSVLGSRFSVVGLAVGVSGEYLAQVFVACLTLWIISALLFWISKHRFKTVSFPT